MRRVRWGVVPVPTVRARVPRVASVPRGVVVALGVFFLSLFYCLRVVADR